MPEFKKDEIIEYYDVCEKNYKRWWELDKSHAMHAGYWDETTQHLHEALIRENEILAQMAKITREDHVLDAGCGVGGSSIYLAQKYECQVKGITLSDQQTKSAKYYADQRKLARPPEFFVMDYTKTDFPSASFDVVWAIESVCHAKDKRDFLKEAWRLLKPKGRLILADGFHARNEYNEEEKRILRKAVNGWAVDSMESMSNFETYLHDQGFQNVSKRDATPHVIKSSRRLFLYSFPAIAWSKVGEYLGWSTKTQTQDFMSYHYQYWSVRKGLAKYIFFYAEKPE